VENAKRCEIATPANQHESGTFCLVESAGAALSPEPAARAPWFCC
jgi:hypothetical protein